MKDFVFQNRLSDCGFCALKIALADMGQNPHYLYLKAPKKWGNYSFLDLVKVAKKQGYLLKGYQVPLHQIPPKKSIALLLKRGSFHYVYIKEIDPQYLYIYDPIKGKRKVKKEVFLSQFIGYYLLVMKKEKEVKIVTSFLSHIPYFVYYGIIFLLLGTSLWLLF